MFNAAKRKQDPEIVLEVLSKIDNAQKENSLAAAQLSWLLRENWEEFDQPDISYLDYAFEKIGKSADTLRRYADVWGFLMTTPVELRWMFKNMPIRRLIRISQVQKKLGREFTKGELSHLSCCATSGQVSEALDEIQEKPQAKSKRIVLFLNRDGDIYARRGNRTVPLGHLLMTADDLTDELRAMGLQRLLKSAGVVEV